MNSVGVRLLVNKFDQCFKFYSETLGLAVAWGKLGEAYASFKINDEIVLSIFEKKLMNKFLNKQDAPFYSDNAVLVIGCDNVDKEYESLKFKEVSFLNKPINMTGWGIRCVHLRDPEGNIIELASPLDLNDWDEDLREQAEEYNWKSE